MYTYKEYRDNEGTIFHEYGAFIRDGGYYNIPTDEYEIEDFEAEGKMVPGKFYYQQDTNSILIITGEKEITKIFRTVSVRNYRSLKPNQVVGFEGYVLDVNIDEDGLISVSNPYSRHNSKDSFSRYGAFSKEAFQFSFETIKKFKLPGLPENMNAVYIGPGETDLITWKLGGKFVKAGLNYSARQHASFSDIISFFGIKKCFSFSPEHVWYAPRLFLLPETIDPETFYIIRKKSNPNDYSFGALEIVDIKTILDDDSILHDKLEQGGFFMGVDEGEIKQVLRLLVDRWETDEDMAKRDLKYLSADEDNENEEVGNDDENEEVGNDEEDSVAFHGELLLFIQKYTDLLIEYKVVIMGSAAAFLYNHNVGKPGDVDLWVNRDVEFVSKLKQLGWEEKDRFFNRDFKNMSPDIKSVTTFSSEEYSFKLQVIRIRKHFLEMSDEFDLSASQVIYNPAINPKTRKEFGFTNTRREVLDDVEQMKAEFLERPWDIEKVRRPDGGIKFTLTKRAIQRILKYQKKGFEIRLSSRSIFSEADFEGFLEQKVSQKEEPGYYSYTGDPSYDFLIEFMKNPRNYVKSNYIRYMLKKVGDIVSIKFTRGLPSQVDVLVKLKPGDYTVRS